MDEEADTSGGEVEADASEILAVSANQAEDGQPQRDDAGGDASMEPGALPVEDPSEVDDDDDGDEGGEPELIDPRTRANRENAARSTGPTTENGKRRSSRNALKHGAYGEKSLAIPSGVLAEDQDAIDEYFSGIVEALDPHTALESRLAERVANLMLRAERLVRYESAMIGAPPDMLVSSIEGADHAYAQACREALRCMDQVTKIDSRISTALQQALRQYQQVREMGLAV
jgi:hypothetical protein